MATEELAIEVIVNGKKAKVELDKVDKATDQIGKTTKETSSVMSSGWLKIGAAVASVTAVMGVAVKRSMELSKATAGLSDEMKDYVRSTSDATGITQEIIAGFVKSGQTANLTAGTIKKITEQAIALGRAYPHESAESFHDNLVMLNKTGEAQGFIVDILEQKYGQMDLKLIPLADKLKTVEEATKGVNGEFQKTSGSKMDIVLNKISNAFIGLGNVLTGLADKFGWLDTVSKTLDHILVKLNGINGMNQEQLQDRLNNLAQQRLEYEKQSVQNAKDLNDANFITKGFYESVQEKIDKNIASVDEQISQASTLLGKKKEQEEAETKLAEEEAKRTQARMNQIKAEEEAAKEAEKAKQDAKNKANALLEAEMKAAAQVQLNYINDLSGSLTDMMLEGKANFADMLKSWAKMIIQSRITSYLGAIFGITTPAPIALPTAGTTKHTGGFIGSIPSHHNGSLRTDERIAKLQVGEAVVNRAGAMNNAGAIAAMNAGQKIGGGDVVINVENKSGMPIDASMISTQQDDSQKIINIVIDGVSRNKSGIRDMLKNI